MGLTSITWSVDGGTTLDTYDVSGSIVWGQLAKTFSCDGTKILIDKDDYDVLMGMHTMTGAEVSAFSDLANIVSVHGAIVLSCW